jgi:hypothetical protein
MSNPAWSVWICGACRRRVPEQVAKCRCGAPREQALGVITPDQDEDEEAAPRLWPKVLGALGFGAALAGSWIWFVEAPTRNARPAGPAVVALPPAAPADPPAVAVQPVLEAPPPTFPAAVEQTPPPQFAWATPTPSPTGAAVATRAVPAAPFVSEADLARQAGLQRLGQEFAALRGNAASLVNMVARYEGAACAGRVDEGCERLLAQIGAIALAVGAAIERTEEIARTSWLDPGVVRDMRTRAGLDDAVWDEIERATREYRR